MIFVALFQFLGDHVPALGAFSVCLLVVSVVGFVAYKVGRHEADKRWVHEVEHMPAVIGQDIRERLERKIVELAARNKYLTERNDQMMPAFKSLTVIADRMLEDRK